MRLLALEWNDTEARAAVAATRGKDVSFEHAFVVSMRPDAGPEAPAVDVGQRLAAALAARGIGKLDALVAVGRTNVELRQLSLPPAPDEELPDMVRLMALREFSGVDESWPVDFLPIEGPADQARSVLAAAINPEQISQIEAVCQKPGLRPKRLVLRACGAASLLTRFSPGAAPQVRLLVDLLSDETDLTVICDGQVVFLRTTRLPCDPLCEPEGAQILVGEIRRTMAAVQNQLGGRRVESIVVFGSGNDHNTLAAGLSDRLGTPCVLFDPFDALDLRGDLVRSLPERSGRFAPLLGMLLDELEQRSPGIDFLHPRRRPTPVSNRRTYALAGAVGALLLLWAGVWLATSSGGAKEERAKLENKLKALDRDINALKQETKPVKDIEAWLAGDVGMLDELHRLSSKLPPAEDALLTSLEFQSGKGGGEMKVEGRVGPKVTGMEQAASDETHRVTVKDKVDNATLKPYTMQFNATVRIGQDKEKAAPGPARVAQTEKRP